MPLYMHLYVEGSQKRLPGLIGWRPEQWLVVGERQLTTVYSNSANQGSFALFLKSKVFLDDESRNAFLSTLRKADERLLEQCRRMCFTDYEQRTRQELLTDLKIFLDLFSNKFSLYSIPKMVDAAVPELLAQGFSKPVEEDMFLEWVVKGSMSDYSRERFTLLHVAQQIQNAGLESFFISSTCADIIERLGRFHPELYHKIEKYAREFAWVPVSHHVQPMNLDQAIRAVQNTLRDTAFQKEYNHFIEQSLVDTKKYLTDSIWYVPTEEDQKLLSFFRQMNEINEARKAAMSKALLLSYPLFQEIAARLKSDVVSVRQLTGEELLQALKRGSLNESDVTTISQRLEAYVFHSEADTIHIHQGEGAQRFIKDTFPPVADTKELRGTVASPGRAQGRVRLILSENQIEHLVEGEVLVTSMTDPDMVPAMKKAAAIVTDEGGITCHAAIVSRELGKPCVIGTKIGTKVLKDGDLVEVDATKGIVKKLSL